MKVVQTLANDVTLQAIIEQIHESHQPTLIQTQKGDAVILAKEDWDSIQETLYLQSIPGFVDAIREAEENDDWVSEVEFMQALDDVDN